MSKDNNKNIDEENAVIDEQEDIEDVEDDSFLDDEDEVDIKMLQNIIDEIEDIKPYEERRRNKTNNLAPKRQKEKVDYLAVFRNMNKKMVLICATLVLSVVLLVALIVDVSSKGKNSKAEDVSKMHLKKVTNKEIKNLVNDYIEAIENVDMKSLKKLVDNVDNISEDKLSLEKQYIEAYEDVSLSFVKGASKDEYVVFAEYNNKIVNIDTPAPGAMMLYVSKNDGKYVVCTAIEQNEAILEYIKSLAANEEVIQFNDDVNEKLEKACKKDKNLAKFISAITPVDTSASEETTKKSDKTEETTKKSNKKDEEETTKKKSDKKDKEETTKKKSDKKDKEETTKKKSDKKDEEETTKKKSKKKDEEETTKKKSKKKDEEKTTKKKSSKNKSTESTEE